ncbi:hypothetical protein KR044_005547 [Drosophila immigrans]|nr:hypothetical protein KR044_005547 [Drosophila immigrans]
MGSVCFLLLLLLGGTSILTAALDELEIDEQVAPPPEAPRPSMWRHFMGQVRQALKRWRPAAGHIARTTTSHPRVQLRSTTESELQFYGALNPIYQMNNF